MNHRIATWTCLALLAAGALGCPKAPSPDYEGTRRRSAESHESLDGQK